MLDQYEVGQEVNVSFDIRGNEYNGKYFVNLSCWKLQSGSNSGGGGGGGSSAPASRSAPRPQAHAEPSPEDLRNDSDFDDEVPF